MKHLLVISDMVGGGAQKGIATLLSNGFLGANPIHVLAFISGDGKSLPVFKMLPPHVTVNVLYQAPRFTPAIILKCLVRYPLEIIKFKPTHVYLSIFHANAIGRFWAHFTPWLKTFTFEHNTGYPNKLYGPILKLLSTPIRGAFADCRETLEAQSQWYWQPRKLQRFVVPLLSLPDDTSLSAKTFSLPLAILSVGRLHPIKNHRTAINAIHSLKRAGIPLHYTIYGDGPLRTSLNQQIKDLGLTDTVTLAGFNPNWTNDAKNFNVFLHPSYAEGLSIVTLEAMAAGLPVVATEVGGIRSYGTPLKTYVPIPSPNSDEDIAHALTTLIETPGLALTIGRAAHKAALALYSQDAVVKLIAAVNVRLGLGPAHFQTNHGQDS